MAATRKTMNWADVDEEDDDNDIKTGTQGFKTGPDENGIVTEIAYIERAGATYKVIKRSKQHITNSWTNKHMVARKTMAKFGKEAAGGADEGKKLVVQSEEDIPVELSRKLAAQAAVKDEAEDKFHEESLLLAETMNQQKKAWTAARKDDDAIGAEAPKEDKVSDLRDVMNERAAASGVEPGKSTYVPPSLRGKGAEGDAKGKGKGMNTEEISLRITNLSDDAREGDLWDLFGSVGRLSRVHLAKDMETNKSKGFAFVSYHNKEDAQKAIDKLNGHGYDNLILQVQFAKPRT